MDRGKRVMLAQYNVAISEPDAFIKYYMDETDVRKWYVLLHGITGDNAEFTDGQYLVRMEFPDKFPIDPPWFFLMTPNGVYDTEKKVCIDIGGYHKGNYPSALGARGFAKQLVSGLIGWKTLEGGISLIDTTVKEKQKLAKDSILYNSLNHGKYMAMINDAYNAYTKKHAIVMPTSNDQVEVNVSATTNS